MKAIIEGRRYNTETATEIADHSGGGYNGDFHHYEESLYRTRNGRYFLAGSGGAMSHYSVSIGQNQWGPGSTIKPLTNEEAQQWCESTKNYDALEEQFSAELEDA